MRTLKCKAQPTDSFSAAVNQILGPSSNLRVLPSAVRIIRIFNLQSSASSIKRTAKNKDLQLIVANIVVFGGKFLKKPDYLEMRRTYVR